MKKSNLLSKLIGVIVIFISCTIFLYWQNNDIMITKINYISEKIPKDFNNTVIVQLSDLHNKGFKENQSILIEKIQDSKPDMIMITGDLIDSSRVGTTNALALIEQIVPIAPVFYVTGNHEAADRGYRTLRKTLIDDGVKVLENQNIPIEKGDSMISLVGMEDPNFGRKEEFIEKEGLIEDSSLFTILLAHRPELAEVYKALGFDLVFTGHAHGGQFRFPFIKGSYAPGQGIFPEYTSGSYQLEDTTMIVNRGLGNSVIPIRIGNRPEIIVVTLQTL